MPRIMGIGNISKLSTKHKPKRAGSFKSLGVILEGDPSRFPGMTKGSRKAKGMGAAGKRRGLRGTHQQHDDSARYALQDAKRALTHASLSTGCDLRIRRALTTLRHAANARLELVWAERTVKTDADGYPQYMSPDTRGKELSAIEVKASNIIRNCGAKSSK